MDTIQEEYVSSKRANYTAEEINQFSTDGLFALFSEYTCDMELPEDFHLNLTMERLLWFSQNAIKTNAEHPHLTCAVWVASHLHKRLSSEIRNVRLS